MEWLRPNLAEDKNILSSPNPNPNPKPEKQFLMEKAIFLKNKIKIIQKRLEDIKYNK